MKIKFRNRTINVFDAMYWLSLLALFCVYFGHSYLRAGYYVMLAVTLIFAAISFVKRRKILHKKFLLWYFVFFLFCTFSMLWTNDEAYSFDGVKNVLLILVALISVCTYAYDAKKMHNLAGAYVLGGVYMCARLLLFETNEAQITNDYGQAVGLYFNELALILSFGVAICLYFVLRNWNKNKVKVVLFFATGMLFYYIIFVTGSRKSLLLPVVLIVILLGTFILRKFRANLKKNLSGLVTSSIVILLAFGLAMLINPRLENRFVDLGKSFVGVETSDLSVNERDFYREEAMLMFRLNPLIGNGINTFTPHVAEIGYWHVAYSHCNYTELLSGLGVIGFIIYYYEYFIIFKKNFEKSHRAGTLSQQFALAGIITLFLFEYGMVDYYFLPAQIMIAILAMTTTFNKLEDAKLLEAGNVQKND